MKQIPPISEKIGNKLDLIDNFVVKFEKNKFVEKHGRLLFLFVYPIMLPIAILALLLIYPIGCIVVLEKSYYDHYCNSCRKLFYSKLEKEFCNDCCVIKDIIE